MKALKTILIVIIIIVALFFIIGLFLPTQVHVEESMLMKCPAKTAFEQVNNYSNWNPWSPFQEADTTMVITLEGEESGVGAIMKWTGDGGVGTQTIVESIEPTYIKHVIDFMEKGKAESEWKFEESDTGMIVTWTLDVMDLGYPVERYYGLLMPKMMRTVYAKGLTNLRNLCENLPEINGLAVQKINTQPALIIVDSAGVDMIGMKMSQMYGELMGFMKAKNITMAGPPFAAYYSWDPDKPFVFEAGIPIGEPAEGEGRIEYKEIPAGKAIVAPYYGDYENTGNIHNAIQEYLKVKKMEFIGAPWEVYITDPMSEPDTNKWLTMIYYRIE